MTVSARTALLSLSLLLIALAPRAHAQDESTAPPGPTEYRFDVGLIGGVHIFNQEHSLRRVSDDPAELSPRTAGALGLNFAVLFNRYLSLEVEALGSRTLTRDDTTELWVFQFGGHLVLNLYPKGPVRPFLLVGYAAMASWVDENPVLPDDQDGMLRAGLGFKIPIGDRLAIRVEGRVMTPTAFASSVLRLGDETEYGGPDFQILGGLALSFGEIEKQLVVKERVVVKQAPPSPDPDKDGVVGAADKCPEVAEDPDGFEDEDGCPDNDNDKDGIPDVSDKCPLKAETQNGIDDEDGCPEEDTDGDGILGSRDQCPNEPETKNGYKDSDGCPDEIPAEVKKFTGVIQGINFKTGSAKLLKNSFPMLDRAVKVLQDYPEIRMEISGHTDDRGKADYNRDLSQKRAESVREYLVSKGINPDRLTAVGYGLDRPIAPNKTKTGRSKNRRTEFQIITEEPKK